MRGVTKKNVLLVSASNMSRGGVEAFLMNWIKQSGKLDINYNWVIPGVVLDEEYAEEFRKLGVNTFVMGDERIGDDRNLKRAVSLFKYLYSLCKSENFDILHVHSGSVFVNAVALAASKFSGVKMRIAHSHSSGAARKSGIGKIINLVSRLIINQCATKKAACSILAADALFGKKQAKNAILIPNCIDAKRFAFSEESRRIIRNQYGLEVYFVIGQVARLSPEKNLKFLVDVFEHVHKKDLNTRLMLVGGGPEEAELKQYVLAAGLTNEVIFTGPTGEPEKYLSAMDMLVFPSIFEGFPVALLEAQSSGLPGIVSDSVTSEVSVTDLLRYLPLHDGSEKWAEVVLATRTRTFADRREYWLRIQKAGFDVSSFMQIVKELYQ